MEQACLEKFEDTIGITMVISVGGYANYSTGESAHTPAILHLL